MIDSCRPRKLEPGFAATYSKPSDFSTSSMKSEPLRWLSPMIWTSPGPIASPAAVMMGVTPCAAETGAAGRAGGVVCAAASAGNAVVDPMIAAAPASALFCRNALRSMDMDVERFFRDITRTPLLTDVCRAYYHRYLETSGCERVARRGCEEGLEARPSAWRASSRVCGYSHTALLYMSVPLGAPADQPGRRFAADVLPVSSDGFTAA